MSQPTKRASDEERHNVVEALRDAAATGQLTMEELDERVSRALDARTRGELAAMLTDLTVHARLAGAPARLPWLPGRLPFASSWTVTATLSHTHAEVLEHLIPIFTRDGYELVDRAADRFVLRWRRPRGLLFAIFGFFAFLLPRDTDTITIDLTTRNRSTTATVQGVAPLRLRRAFIQLEADLDGSSF